MKRVSMSTLVGAIACTALAGTAANAQTSTLYVTDGDSSRMAIVQGGVATIVSTHNKGYPIVVNSSVWIGDYNGTQPNTIEYDLAGTATGNFGAYSPVFAVDAGTDGTRSFELGNAFSSSATVYSLNSDLSGTPTAMFNVSGNQLVGITYDSASGNLWISDGTTIFEYTTGGALVSSFAHNSDRGCLAYEAATDTLWYVPNGINDILQFSKSGTLLQTVNVPGLASNNWGAEFAFGGTPTFTLSTSGSCPGQVTVTWQNAMPNTNLALVFAKNTGSFAIPTGPCQGTILGLGTQGIRLVNTFPSGPNGSGSRSANAGTSSCRAYLQMVEVPGCNLTNVAQIP